jgi:hypothetical protein
MRLLIAQDEQVSKRTTVSCLVRPAGGIQIYATAQKAGIRLPANDPGRAVPGVQLRFKWESSLSGDNACLLPLRLDSNMASSFERQFRMCVVVSNAPAWGGWLAFRMEAERVQIKSRMSRV